MQRIPTDFLIGDGKRLRITTYESSSWIMHFQPFGVVNSRQPESINAVNYISEFTKAELFLFRVVFDHKDENNKLTLRLRLFSPAEQAKLKKAIQHWIKKALLVRIKREYYMVNPWFLTPPKQEQVKAMDFWKALNHKC